MPWTRLLVKLAARFPLPLDGAALHRMGLAAMHAGRFPDADALFERAASRYRADLNVEPLARLRAHQAIARVRSSGRDEPERLLEVERQLYRLRTIEALDPPHELVDAGRLLASWHPESPALHAHPRPIPLRHPARGL